MTECGDVAYGSIALIILGGIVGGVIAWLAAKASLYKKLYEGKD